MNTVRMLLLTTVSENNRNLQNMSYATKFYGKMTVKYVLQFTVSQLVQYVQQWIQYFKKVIWSSVIPSEEIQILLSFFWQKIIAKYFSDKKVFAS